MYSKFGRQQKKANSGEKKVTPSLPIEKANMMVKAEKIAKKPEEEEQQQKTKKEDEQKEKKELRKSLESNRKKILELEKALKASLQRQNVAREQNNMVNREKDLLISQLTLLLREFKTRLEKAETQNDELRSETTYQQKVLARQQQQHHQKKNLTKSQRRWTTLNTSSLNKSNHHQHHKLEIRSLSQERLKEKRKLGVPYGDPDEDQEDGVVDIEFEYPVKEEKRHHIQIGSVGVSELMS